jgi:hypothetical protein
MASRNALFALAAIVLSAVLVAGILATNWLTHEFADLHGPVGCVALVPAVLMFVLGSLVLAVVWWQQRRR